MLKDSVYSVISYHIVTLLALSILFSANDIEFDTAEDTDFVVSIGLMLLQVILS